MPKLLDKKSPIQGASRSWPYRLASAIRAAPSMVPDPQGRGIASSSGVRGRECEGDACVAPTKDAGLNPPYKS